MMGTLPLQPASPKAAGHRNGNGTRFFGSQIGGRSVISYGYTDMPWRLMAWDVFYFFKYSQAIPYILWPLFPADSGELSELSPTWGNAFCIAIHLVLCVTQLAGIVAFPSLVVLPVWAAVLLVAVFLLVNKALCTLLNGNGVEFYSDPEYAPLLPEHAHEQWIYINGVAAGAHWMQGNLNRLAVTFKRPILGIHNKTYGIIFDVIECLIQRNCGYATKDVRVCYQIIKKTLYNPRYSKVVFILHSQGGIEGSLVLDWLLQELPQDLLSKLEVYTFGNAANHFNNPHRRLRSQTLAKRNPLAASIDSQDHEPQPRSRPRRNAHHHRHGNHSDSTTPLLTLTSTSTTSPNPSTLSGRAIGHIEHYAHTTDFVALWGVLHFTTSRPKTRFIPRFIGRVFARTDPRGRGGHQMVQHYLDGMFPLKRDPATGRLARDAEGVPCGVDEAGNEFMESWVYLGAEHRDENGEESSGDADEEVEVHGLGSSGGGSPVLEKLKGLKEGLGEEKGGVRVKVKELSRLWQYRNGQSPEEKPPLLVRGVDGVVRNATV